MVELQQSQLQLEDHASIMDETAIRAQVIGRSAGTISGIGPAPHKSYINTRKAPSKVIELLELLTQKDKDKTEQLELLTQNDKDKDNLISQLT